MMELVLINESEIKVPRLYLQDWLAFVHHQFVRKKILKKNENRSLSVIFLNEAPARAMNLQFRKKDYATDILSFESADPESFGDLAVCSQVAQKQSIEHKLSYRDELAYILLHGWLHLLGYEHEQGGKEAELMFKLQDELFEKIDKFRSHSR